MVNDLIERSAGHYIIPPKKKKCPHFCNVLKCSSASLALSRFCKGSHVLSESGYPLHFTRNSEWLYLFLSVITCLTSYSSVSSIMSGGGGADLGKVSDTIYGFR